MKHKIFEYAKRYLLYLQFEKRLESNTLNSYWYDLEKYINYLTEDLNIYNLDKV